MKILENYIAPTEHSQGDVGDIWIDKSTGDVYKCTGLTGSAKDLGYIAIGADATNTKYTWEKAGAGAGGSVPTCTVRFVNGENVRYAGHLCCTRHVDGVFDFYEVNDYEGTETFDITLDNVVCGSLILFEWELTGITEPDNSYDGGIEPISVMADVVSTTTFKAPSEQGAIATATINAISMM